jgi:hypothetical protein
VKTGHRASRIGDGQTPNVASLRAGHPTAVSGLPSTAPELPWVTATSRGPETQVPDGLDVDQVSWLIVCATKVIARQKVRCRPTYVSDGTVVLVFPPLGPVGAGRGP